MSLRAFGLQTFCLAGWLALVPAAAPQVAAEEGNMTAELRQQRDERMSWWREARFGLFIHWGLYAVPAGEWRGQTHHGEWILHSAQIPVAEYEQFRAQFHPVRFDADAWARMAKDAGMRYIVITSKHHDGFCLFDSQYTDYDMRSTPFKRDVLRELADAARRHGLRIGWYHSIMDWHHPDYLPRREWEDRPAEGADFERYRTHLKNQVRELLTSYGPIGVLWFDGEWEDTWTHAHGRDLYDFCRQADPHVIINNRVDKGRAGMAGLTTDPRYAGDFGTPEQEIPPTGLGDADWETCMTMNDHWGFNRHDDNWKSSRQLIRVLAETASKGGNYLLNIGPTADGEFPAPCVERLRDIGVWMRANGESIYGTRASPLGALPFGRCTQKALPDGRARLYLHVFDWPAEGKLVVHGLANDAERAFLLAAGGPDLPVTRVEDALVVQVPPQAADDADTVVVLDISGAPQVYEPPAITAESDIFLDALDVRVSAAQESVELHYTTDGRVPQADSPRVAGPVRLTDTATVQARGFRASRPVSGVSAATFTRVTPRPAAAPDDVAPGLHYEYYEGEWSRLPSFDELMPAKRGTVPRFDLAPRQRDERFGFRYRGFITVPRDGLYTFFLACDDGGRLLIGDTVVVDNDGLHVLQERSGRIALAAGPHPVTVTYFERTGEDGLAVEFAGPDLPRCRIPDALLSHAAR